MLIDRFESNWQHRLHTQQAALEDGRELILLIDGAFLPDFYLVVNKALNGNGKLWLLFDDVPGSTRETLAVSPFLVACSAMLTSMLMQCSGWPLLSAIETTETIADLAKRLGAWCIVENGNQRFNFRFPDTRRLPAIFAALTDTQRSTLSGPAHRWSYIGRDGAWAELAISATGSAIANHPTLDDRQFAAIVGDSEVDETIVLLQDRGPLPEKLPSEIHALLRDALRVANLVRLDQDLHLEWCTHCLRLTGHPTVAAVNVWRADFDKPKE